jgi:hypothetical protein
VISVSSTSVRSHISISSDSAILQKSPQHTRSTSGGGLPRRSTRTVSTVKRTHSPEIQYLGKYRKPSAATPIRSKRPKFNDDSDVEPLDSVIEVYRPVAPVSHHGAEKLALRLPLRLSPRENLVSNTEQPQAKKSRPLSCITVDSDLEVLIPSSQSDEHELCITGKRGKTWPKSKRA